MSIERTERKRDYKTGRTYDEYQIGYLRGQADAKRHVFDSYLLGKTQLYKIGYSVGFAEMRAAI